MHFDPPEDIYPLSPMQQGMLYQSMRWPGSGVCFEQDVYTIRGELDVPRFRRAWEEAVARHSVLRTTFLWEDIEEPHQIVHQRGVVDLQTEDWRALPAEQQQQKLQDYLAAERQRGFDLTVLPLMRLGLFRVADHRQELVWSFHHTVLDGWSLPLVIADVLAIYIRDERGDAAKLPAPRPYRDFIEWLLNQDLGAAEVYWRRRLEGFTEKTPLTVDRRTLTDAPVGDETFQHLLHRVPAAISDSLTAFLRRHKLTLGTLVQGAWALLLAKYAGAEEVVIGCNISGRPPELAGVEGLVGLFINTLPLRVPTPAGASLLPWLRSIQDQVIETLEYGFSPLVQVQKWSQIPTGQSLFDSIVVIENYPSLNPHSGCRDLEVTYQSWTKHSKTGYPLTLLALPGDELLLEIKFDHRRFDPSTIKRMLAHLQTLLQSMVKDPECNIGELPLLDESERAELIGPSSPLADAVAGSGLPGDGGTTLHELFETQVTRRPEAIALTCDGQSLTYAQLNAQANRLARHLVSHGVKPDALVGLCVDRSNRLVVALLAILKAGGAYLPIDLAYPADRLAFMLEDAQAPVLLTERTLVGNLPPVQATVLCVDELLGGPIEAGEEANLPATAGPDSLAYVIYTSGTTGRPKGSLITHRNVARLFPSTEHWYGFNERDVWTLFHSSAFDFSVWEIWGALLYGGRVVVVPFLVSRSPEAFYELVARERVTVLNQTPSAFRQFMQAEESVGPLDLALRYVIFGGEALEMQSLRTWFERHGDHKPLLVNMYGITETTVHVTYRPLSRTDLDSGSVIGAPIPDLRVHILDAGLQPAPIGVPGEMYVGGAGLARGYLNRPELTRERFVPDHLTKQPGARLYRTGDRARLLPSHDIEYLGRVDHQVKIRGFRIELGEIESVLALHSAVREARVIAREDAPGSKRLVAYLVAPGAPPDVTSLREHLKQRLPEYMVPAAFVFLEKLPLTASGKLDSKALPIPDQRPELARQYVAPRSAAEKTLAEIWTKVLRVERVGIHDNFFELGGDSILSIQIISQARREGLKLTPTLLFAHQTIAELAAVAGITNQAHDSRDPVTGDVPLTPIQHWFFEQQLESPEHYNQAFLFEVAERLDRTALESALRELSRHHDSLRLRFTRGPDGWRQYYSPVEEPAPLSWIATERLEDIAPLATSAQASLNLEAGPLWRVVCFDFGPDRPSRLLVVVHHLAVDGVSWRPLLEDLETAYRQIEAGQPVQLPSKTTSFKVWAQRLQQLAATESLHGELPHWKAIPSLKVTGETTTGNTEESASTVRVSLTAAETDALLRRVPAAYNTQVNDVLLTALARAWHCWSGGDTLLTNLEGHGREDLFEEVDLSRTVGWFTSIFPVSLKLPGSGNSWQPGAALKSVKEQLRQIPQRGIGYGILRYLNHEAGLGEQPEPEIVFNYLGQFDQVIAGSKLFRFAPESTGPWHGPRQPRRNAIELTGLTVGDRLELSWTYSRNLHSQESIGRLAGEFLTALRDVIADCISPSAFGRTPSDYPLARFDQAELDRLAPQLRGIEDIYPLSPIQTLFYSAGPGADSLAFDQWHCTLHGELDVTAFQDAWHETVKRHAILRTTIHGQGLREPVQMVHHDVRLPWTVEDWRDSSPVEHAQRWSAFLKQDRMQSLAATQAPLMRFALARLSDQTWNFAWSVPALLLDGWSWPLVFRDASKLYGAIRQNAAPQLEPVRPYRDYLEWLGQQSTGDALVFWRETLAGFREPTPLPYELPDDSNESTRYLDHVVQLSAEATKALELAARRLQLTVSSLVQGAWALVLNRQSGRSDVVFGAAFAGRPADLRGVESIVGPFVNNLPVRATVTQGDTVGGFFERLHAQLLNLSRFQFTPLIEIQGCSEVPFRNRLFESLVVFQNYLVDDSARSFGGTVNVADFSGPVHTNYPMLLLVDPGAALRMTLIYDRRRVTRATVESWSRDLATILERAPSLLDGRIEELQSLLSAPASGGGQGRRKLRAVPQNFVRPRTEMEQTITGVWQQMFGLDAVSVEENFFDLGGHSLLLVQMHSRLKEVLQTDFPIVACFEYPTVRALAGHLDRPAVSGTSNGTQVRDRAERQKLALAQMRGRLKK